MIGVVSKMENPRIKGKKLGCHMLHDLQDRDRFTPWAAYKDDEVIK